MMLSSEGVNGRCIVPKKNVTTVWDFVFIFMLFTLLHPLYDRHSVLVIATAIVGLIFIVHFLQFLLATGAGSSSGGLLWQSLLEQHQRQEELRQQYNSITTTAIAKITAWLWVDFWWVPVSCLSPSALRTQHHHDLHFESDNENLHPSSIFKAYTFSPPILVSVDLSSPAHAK